MSAVRRTDDRVSLPAPGFRATRPGGWPAGTRSPVAVAGPRRIPTGFPGPPSPRTAIIIAAPDTSPAPGRGGSGCGRTVGTVTGAAPASVEEEDGPEPRPLASVPGARAERGVGARAVRLGEHRRVRVGRVARGGACVSGRPPVPMNVAVPARSPWLSRAHGALRAVGPRGQAVSGLSEPTAGPPTPATGQGADARRSPRWRTAAPGPRGRDAAAQHQREQIVRAWPSVLSPSRDAAPGRRSRRRHGRRAATRRGGRWPPRAPGRGQVRRGGPAPTRPTTPSRTTRRRPAPGAC